MNRKEIGHLAIDLIEEALEKPNTTIILEEKITRSVCESGINESTDEELNIMREDAMKTVINLSKSKLYEAHTGYMLFNHAVVYRNNSRILKNKNAPINF